MIRALLFDAAGTLIEPAEPVVDVYARTAAECGRQIDSREIGPRFREAFSGIRDPDYSAHPDGDAAEREWWMRVVAAVFDESSGVPLAEGFIQPCFEALFSHYASPSAWRIFPEVPDLLTAARKAGFRLAVVSNFDLRLHGILAGHGLEFDVVVTSADARARKPDPAIFRHALDRLGLAPADVLHVGDSRTADLEGARAAGIQALLLQRPTNDLRDFLATALERREK